VAQNSRRYRTSKYLGTVGSYISANRKIEIGISIKIGQAAQSFNRLQNIWKSEAIMTKTKIKIPKFDVRSVLLYASETWRINRKKIDSRPRGFEVRCLRLLGTA
jgi:hypothetical protein